MIRSHLDQLEFKGKWKDAVQLAFDEKNSVIAMSRSVFYGWYLPLESFCIEPEPEEDIIELAHECLVEIFPKSLSSDSPDILREIGYGMNIAGYLFPGNSDENDKLYTDILKRAVELEPECPLSIELYNGSLKKGPLLHNPLSNSEWSEYIDRRFPSDGEYDSYYRSVLRNRVVV
ncbi:hypothetical protein [Kangiella spongicola]|uniref:Uncharacterized protein n=1 Tax=Kangiella spongicola TaxID=796379 RepID=A0A318D1Q9_9GAMM|nr:hypothetical protein [Kangiella spongicola]PXF63166.1 hypothetical protein DL796_06885 [Kangiella spongicola]